MLGVHARKMRLLALFLVCSIVQQTTSSATLNPGIAIGVKSSPKSTPILLHPSLTSASYLQTKPVKRLAKKTNFAALKSALLAQEGGVEDNVAVESAPYESLPQSYQSILPTSYYATHTFVPPVKNLYDYSHLARGKNQSSVKTDQAEEPVESSRTVSDSNQLSVSEDDYQDQQVKEEIISHDDKSQGEDEAYYDTLLQGSAEAEQEETEFRPSSVVPSFVTSSSNRFRQASDSTFGVAVTPITVDSSGHKKSATAPSSTISNFVQTQPRFKIQRPPTTLPKAGILYQQPFNRPLPTKTALDQVLAGGHDRQVTFGQQFDDSPASNSLLLLGPSGPRMPVISRLRQDFSHMMHNFAQGPLKDVTNDLKDWKDSPREPIMSRVGYAMSKIFGGHVGDRTFDGFDWVPLIAVLVAGALILAGLFPSGLSTFGFNQGQIVVGRKSRVEDESLLDQALGQLETGVMMMSALRYEDGCSQRLACKLGQMARTSEILKGQTMNTIFQGVSSFLPEKYSSFARSFRAVADEEDESACQKECYRCIAI